MQIVRIYNSKRKLFNYSGQKGRRETKNHNNYFKRSTRKSGDFNTIEKESKIKL